VCAVLLGLGCGGEVPEALPTTDTGATSPGSTTPTFTAPIQICINEVMTENSGALEVDGTWPDWIELHNPTTAAVSLEDWFIHDEDGSSHRFTSADTIEAGGFLLLYASEVDAEGHLPFKLDNDGDSVVVVRTDQDFIQVDLPASAADWSFARETDCCVGDCWTSALWGTPGASNLTDED